MILFDDMVEKWRWYFWYIVDDFEEIWKTMIYFLGGILYNFKYKSVHAKKN